MLIAYVCMYNIFLNVSVNLQAPYDRFVLKAPITGCELRVINTEEIKQRLVQF